MNIVAQDGKPILIRAIKNENVEIVQALLSQKHIDVNLADKMAILLCIMLF